MHTPTPRRPAGDVQTELTALRARVNELEGQQSETWLNEQRASEVKALVKEVLSDADTRASLADSGLTAGHDKHFFLASEDGNYRLNIMGNLQVRYTWNQRHGPGNVVLTDPTDPTSGVFESGDENTNGFDINRAQITFDGHVVNPNWLYTVRLAADRNDGGLGVEIATIGYRVMDDLTVKAGQFKAPFLHEDMVDDQYQLAVDRSIVTNVLPAPAIIEGVVRLSGMWWTCSASRQPSMMAAARATSTATRWARSRPALPPAWTLRMIAPTSPSAAVSTSRSWATGASTTTSPRGPATTPPCSWAARSVGM